MWQGFGRMTREEEAAARKAIEDEKVRDLLLKSYICIYWHVTCFFFA